MSVQAGQNRFTLHVRLTGPWQSPITAASSSHDLWPHLPLSSLQAGAASSSCRPAGNRARCASVSSRLSESQPVVETYDACRPCVQQAVPTAVLQLSSAWSDEHGGPFYLHLIPILKYRQISPQTSRVGFHSKKRVQLRPVMSSEYITDTHLQQQRKNNEDPAL